MRSSIVVYKKIKWRHVTEKCALKIYNFSSSIISSSYSHTKLFKTVANTSQVVAEWINLYHFKWWLLSCRFVFGVSVVSFQFDSVSMSLSLKRWMRGKNVYGCQYISKHLEDCEKNVENWNSNEDSSLVATFSRIIFYRKSLSCHF